MLADHRDRPRPVGERRPGQESLVPAAVEDGPGVVAHAAVDRHVRADAGQVLDGADRVERDRRGRDDGPPRLGGDAGGDAGGRARRRGRIAPTARWSALPRPRRRRRRGRRRWTARRGRAPSRNGASTSIGLLEEVGDEDLAADVDVHADEVDRGRDRRALDGLGRIARRRCRSRTSSRSGRCGRTRGCGPRRPGVMRTSTRGTSAVLLVQRSRRSSSSNESTTMRPTPVRERRRSSSSHLLLPCSTSRSPGTPAAERDVQLAAGGDVECMPSSSASGPWRGRGTPWWRRPRRRRRRRPPRGSEPADAPRRRRTAACRTRGASVELSSSRRSCSQPSARRPRQCRAAAAGAQAGSARSTSTLARTRRGGRARWRARRGPTRPATAGPG